jgi:hypothetical protein
VYSNLLIRNNRKVMATAGKNQVPLGWRTVFARRKKAIARLRWKTRTTKI